MTEKQYILESPEDLTAFRLVLSSAGLMAPDAEEAIAFLTDKFLAPIPKIYGAKFEWLKECAKLAKSYLDELPDTADPTFYKTSTDSIPAWSGKTKVTTYDAPNGVPSTAQAVGMTVEERDAPDPAQTSTDSPRGTLSAAAIEAVNARRDAIKRAFQPMILPIWGEDD